ncbi:MarR family winged helix-turn-helix transcriptional regulator [Nocardioides hwasunensis]|uniref:MarR family transcriptional regulator n=1 Tax=Nocardioides hwasunensis TaxID=397258 RepID=A0ABR8MF94_9ACTN|nr:MarR family transcriptional regulator [Nocardioides hwasunensis]MBD3914773.1 MarR family transcriptional regulator [Nocardioides hwasunensis]
MAVVKAPPLLDQLCFDLYAASRAVTAAYRPVLSALGLTYPQYLVLIVLWERDDQSVSDIARELQLDHGTLTPLLKRMEARGLVERRRDRVDERLVRVRLAAEGEELRRHADRIHCDMKSLLGLDETAFAELQETLRAVTARTSA